MLIPFIVKFPEDENNNIKKFIERSLLERIKGQLKKILKWHKIYRKHLSIFFPDFKLLSRRPGVLPQLHQRQILRTEKRAMPRKKKLPVLFAKTTEFSIPLQ